MGLKGQFKWSYPGPSSYSDNQISSCMFARHSLSVGRTQSHCVTIIAIIFAYVKSSSSLVVLEEGFGI